MQAALDQLLDLKTLVESKLLPMFERLDDSRRMDHPAVYLVLRTDARSFASQALDEVQLQWSSNQRQRQLAIAGAATKAGNSVVKKPSPLDRLIPVSRRSNGFGPQLDAFRKNNVDLIESLSRSFLDNVRKVLEDAENADLRVEDLADQIQIQFGVSESRAELIARDQTLKLNGQIAQSKQKLAGIERFVWTTSGDERVREEHAELDGQVFDWNNLPDVGAPGEDFQCRCTAFPLIEGVDYPEGE